MRENVDIRPGKLLLDFDVAGQELVPSGNVESRREVTAAFLTRSVLGEHSRGDDTEKPDQQREARNTPDRRIMIFLLPVSTGAVHKAWREDSQYACRDIAVNRNVCLTTSRVD